MNEIKKFFEGRRNILFGENILIYFYNMENTGDLKKEMAALNTILPIKLKNNLDKAYEVYLLLKEKEGDEKSKEILEQCDDVIYENEETLNYILREYANKIEL